MPYPHPALPPQKLELDNHYSEIFFPSGCKAEVVGKPEPAFFHSALHDLKCSPSQAVMIGDVSLNFGYPVHLVHYIKTGKIPHGTGT